MVLYYLIGKQNQKTLGSFQLRKREPSSSLRKVTASPFLSGTAHTKCRENTWAELGAARSWSVPRLAARGVFPVAMWGSGSNMETWKTWDLPVSSPFDFFLINIHLTNMYYICVYICICVCVLMCTYLHTSMDHFYCLP